MINEYAAAGNLTMLQWLHQAGYYISPDMKTAVSAAINGNTGVLAWLLGHEAWSSDQLGNWNKDLIRYSMYSNPWPVPTLMLWDKYQQPLTADLRKQLQLAWAISCVFHGLIRWRRSQAFKQPSAGSSKSVSSSKSATNTCCACHDPGQELLTNLCRLPHERKREISSCPFSQY